MTVSSQLDEKYISLSHITFFIDCNIEGQMIIQDRFDAGSGHGWSGAHSVVWNTVAHGGMIVQKPPVGHNFLSK